MKYLQDLWQVTARNVPSGPAKAALYALFRETDARLVAEVEVARHIPQPFPVHHEHRALP